MSTQPLPNRPLRLDDSARIRDAAGLADFLFRPIVFQEPARVVDPPSWLEHIPFAFWIVEAMRPATFVELGTHSGNSYAGFAQAVQVLGLSTACYAIDTWEGDSQSGLYGEDVFREWSAYHDRHFSSFSRLIRSTFAEAAQHFPDGGIDLLHSDGCHTYESVSADLETWRPKMSRAGVLLVHDINVRERDFGAWRLWEELKERSPSFEFLHGHGLGVLGVGSEFPEPLRWLFSASEETTSVVRQFFARMGGVIAARFAAGRDREAAAQEARELVTREQEARELVTRDQEQRRQLELAGEQQRAAIAALTEEQSVQQAAILRLTDDLTRSLGRCSTLTADLEATAARSQEDAQTISALEELSSRKTQLAGELSERLRQESERRQQAESVRARLESRQSGPVTVQMRGKRFTTDWRALARWLRSLPGTAAQVRPHPGAGKGAVVPFLTFLVRPQALRDASRIVASGLFDEAYYLQHHPDVARSRMSPLAHFVLRGAAEGRKPHPLFDTDYYLRANPDVARSGINPLAHYAAHGAFEGRRPHPLFDPSYYLETNPDVRDARIEPLGHFLRSGGVEGRNPNPFFDSAYYLRTNPDVAECGANPLLHFHFDGWREGRRTSPYFDTAFYLSQNADVRAVDSNPLAHYLECGRREGRDAVDPAEIRNAPLAVGGASDVRIRAVALSEERPGKPTILCLSHVMPWPPRAGNEYRIYRLLRWFRDQGYRIVPVIAPLPGEPVTGEAVRALADEFSNAVLCDRDGRLEYVLRDVPDNLSVLAGEPPRPIAALLGEDVADDARERALLQVDRTFCHDAVITAVLRLQNVLGRHIFITEYIWMSRILPLVSREAFKVVDTIDVFSTKRQKVLQFGVDDVHVEPREEAWRLRDADLVLAIQEDERRELQRLLPGKRVVTAGVDFDVVEGTGMPSGRSLLCVASANPLNKKGLRDFLRFAWPHVRQNVPDAELFLAGRVSQAAIADMPGVVRLGHVADLTPLYARARLVINPAVAGTGVKIKTLEALSHLRPIVTWPNGADGLHADLASLCVIVHDWYEFARKVTELLLSEAPRVFSAAEREAVARLMSPAVAYGSMRDAMTEFLDVHEPRR